MNAEARTAAIMETQSDAAAAPSSLLVPGLTFPSSMCSIPFFFPRFYPFFSASAASMAADERPIRPAGVNKAVDHSCEQCIYRRPFFLPV